MTDITRRTALVVAGAAFASPALAQGSAIRSARSPRGRCEIALRWSAEGGAEYRVILRARRASPRVVVDWSKLGIATQIYTSFQVRDPVVSDFSSGVELVAIEETQGEDAYTLVTSKRRENRARWRQISLTMRHRATERLLRIDARAYDEGVAFRYVLPESSPMHHWLREEKTEFNMGASGRHWGQPYDFFTMYHPSYETPYDSRPLGTSTPPASGVGWGFPSLFELDGAWVLMHETGLEANFHGSHLAKDAPGGVYRIAPPSAEEALGLAANTPSSPLPWEMPWRMLVVADDLADVVESNLVFHLARPTRIADTSWIKPGVASWNWAFDHDSGMDQAKLRAFIDSAAAMGWPYTLIDANWNLSGERAMERLVEYADARNVSLLFWYNSGGRHNNVPDQPRNIMDDRARRRAEFARLHELGVKGVKVDFWQSDKQDIIKLYLDLLEDAGDFQLLCNFHGCTIPRGWQRTYPHLVSMEAVRGSEFYSFPSEPDYGLLAPRQNTIHPFLRNVIGSMDYTPVLFSHLTVDARTTKAHEAALAVVFESGVQHFCDGPDVYRNLPGDWRDYLSQVPTAWDETRLLAGAPGAHVVIARRNGARWYVAGINGEDARKEIAFDLSRLAGLGQEAVILTDDGGGGFASRRGPPPGAEPMLPYGGFVMIF
jgi:hypothetical protein